MSGHDPYTYLKDVLEQVPTQPASKIADETMRLLVSDKHDRSCA